MKRLFAGAILLSCVSAASAQTSERHFDPDLAGQSVDCSGFRRESDGAWTALKTLPVQRQNEFTEIAAGTRLSPGGPKVVGIDIGAALDEACPH